MSEYLLKMAKRIRRMKSDSAERETEVIVEGLTAFLDGSRLALDCG